MAQIESKGQSEQRHTTTGTSTKRTLTQTEHRLQLGCAVMRESDGAHPNGEHDVPELRHVPQENVDLIHDDSTTALQADVPRLQCMSSRVADPWPQHAELSLARGRMEHGGSDSAMQG